MAVESGGSVWRRKVTVVVAATRDGGTHAWQALLAHDAAELVGSTLAVLVLSVLIAGCFFRDPLDPHGELDHRIVRNFEDAEQVTHSRAAFERARQRVPRVQSGMTVPEVETAMQAIVFTQQQGDKPEKDAPRQKLIEGLLCRRNPTPLSQRWLFGFDEDGVELVGFVLEFQRNDPESEKWIVRSIDRKPTDDCPGGENE